jgi:hypothetical protein
MSFSWFHLGDVARAAPPTVSISLFSLLSCRSRAPEGRESGRSVRHRVRESIAAGPRRRRSGGARVPGGSPRRRLLHPGSRSGAAHRAICAVRPGERRASDPVAALQDEVQLQEYGGHRRLERGERPGGALEGDHLARELVEPDPGSRRSRMVDTPMLFGACEARELSAGKRRLPRSSIAGMGRGPPWRTCRR